MKSVLTDVTGNIQSITEVGEEFEIHEGGELKWIQVDDGVDICDKIRDGVAVHPSTLVDETSRFKASIERGILYGDLGAQLDLIYQDLKNGTTEFVSFIDDVKANSISPRTQSDTDGIEWVPSDRPAWEKP
jgi:hypothetical protein